MIKRTFFITTLLLLFIPCLSFAELKTFEKEYTYEASELDSKVTSRFNALEQAKRMLLEELGVFLTSRTEVANSQLTKDEIASITAGIVSAVVIDEKWDGHKYWLRAKIDADPSVVQQAIEVIRQDDKKTKDLEQAQKRIEQLTKDLESVKSNLGDNPQERQKRYTQIVNQKQSMDWVIKFYNLFNDKKSFADNKEALDAINKAIELDPEYLVPYIMRAVLYAEVAKNYQKGIEDITTAIKYFKTGPNNPYENTAMLYEERGKYYLRQNKLSLAMGDFMSALEVDPRQVLRGHSEFKGMDINVFVKKLPKDYRSYVLRARYNSYFESCSDNSNAYDDAIADIKKALKLNDKNPITYYVLTEVLGYKAMWYEARHYNEIDFASHNAIVDATTKGLKLSTRNEWKKRFLERRAHEYLILKQYKLAVADYKSRIQLNPDDAGAYHDKAIAYMELGEFNEAVNDITKAIGMKNSSVDWPRSGYEIRAKVYEKMGKYKEAVEDYSNAFNTWEKAFGTFIKEQKLGSSVAYDILTKRGDARRQVGDFSKAIEDYRLAIEWSKEFHPSMIYEEIGDTYMDLEKPEEALIEYDKAILINNQADYHKNKRDKLDVIASGYYVKKANAYMMLDKIDNAIDSYKLALDAIDDAKPQFKCEIYRDMGLLYQRLGIDQEAVKYFREAVKSGELNGSADFFSYSLLAQMELKMGNEEEAFRVFNKMVRFYPKVIGSYNARGGAHLSLGNYKEAITDFNKVVDIAPTNSYAYYNRAIAYIKLGQNEQGINDLRISARLGSQDAQRTLKENNLNW